MHSTRSHLFKLFFIALALGLSQCGSKKNKAQDIVISVAPPSPIVFTSDIHTTVGGQATTITHPWFKFTVSINNQSDTPITVIGLEVTVTAMDDSGNISSKVTTFDPSSFNYSTTTLQCVYSDFGTFTPGSPSQPDAAMPAVCPNSGSWTNSQGQAIKCAAGTDLVPLLNNSVLYMLPSGTGCIFGAPDFYVGSNDSGPNHNNFRYTVKVKPLGWFGDRTHPTDRYENSINVYTQ